MPGILFGPAMVGILIDHGDFSEEFATEISWGRGDEHGTFTFRCESDFGTLPLFHMTSDGQLNLQINFLREKDLPKQVLRDMIVKLEANFLRDYDDESYPSDSYENMEFLFQSDVILLLRLQAKLNKHK